MPTNNEPLTTERQLAALAEPLAWFIPFVLQRGIDGQLARRAAVGYLVGQQERDDNAGVDLVARKMLVAALKQFDGNATADVPMMADNVMRLFRAISPEEVAQIIDQSVPRPVLEQYGSAIDVLNELQAEYDTGSEGEHFDRLDEDEDEAQDMAMPFAEGSAAQGTSLNRAKHLSPGDANRVVASSLRNCGYSTRRVGADFGQ
jgi:hypothetical protein